MGRAGRGAGFVRLGRSRAGSGQDRVRPGGCVARTEGVWWHACPHSFHHCRRGGGRQSRCASVADSRGGAKRGGTSRRGIPGNRADRARGCARLRQDRVGNGSGRWAREGARGAEFLTKKIREKTWTGSWLEGGWRLDFGCGTSARETRGGSEIRDGFRLRAASLESECVRRRRRFARLGGRREQLTSGVRVGDDVGRAAILRSGSRGLPYLNRG